MIISIAWASQYLSYLRYLKLMHVLPLDCVFVNIKYIKPNEFSWISKDLKEIGIINIKKMHNIRRTAYFSL